MKRKRHGQQNEGNALWEVVVDNRREESGMLRRTEKLLSLAPVVSHTILLSPRRG